MSLPSTFNMHRVSSPLPIDLFSNTYINFSFPLHCHQTYLIQLVDRGINHFSCNGSRYSVGKGTILLMTPEEIHNGCGNRDEALHYKVFYLNEKELSDDNSGFNIDRHIRFNQTVLWNPEIANLINQLYTINSHDNEFLAYELFQNIRNSLLLNYSNFKLNIKESSRRYDEIVRRSKEYIHDQLQQPLRLVDISKSVYLSPFHLLRIFKEHTGITLHQYIINARIEKGKELIKSKRYSLGDLYYETGFSDPSNFTKSFKKITGQTPSQFRKIWK